MSFPIYRLKERAFIYYLFDFILFIFFFSFFISEIKCGNSRIALREITYWSILDAYSRKEIKLNEFLIFFFYYLLF